MSRMSLKFLRAWPARVFGFLLILLLLLTLLLTYLLYSQQGLQWAAALVQKISAEQITIAAMQGRLAGPLTISQFSYQSAGLKVSAQGIDLDFNPAHLLAAKLTINNITVRQLAIEMAESETQQTEIELPAIFLPIAIDLKKLSLLDGVTIKTIDSTVHTLQQAAFSARLERDGKLDISELTLLHPQGQLALSGHIALTGNYPLQLKNRMNIHVSDKPTYIMSGVLSGDMNRLHLQQTLTDQAQTSILGLTAELGDLLNDLHFQFDVVSDKLAVKQFAQQLPEMTVTAAIKVMGKPQQFKLSGEYQLANHQYAEMPEEILGRFRADYQQDIVDNIRLQINDKYSPLSIVLTGKVTNPVNQPGVALVSDISNFQWPMHAEKQAVDVAFKHAQAILTGTPDNFTLDISTAITGQNIPPSTITVHAAGNKNQVAIKDSAIALLNGHMDVAGQIDLQDYDASVLSIHARNLEGQTFWPKLVEHSLSFDSRIKGLNIIGQQPVHLDFSAISGHINQYPLAGHGQIVLTERGIDLPIFKLTTSKLLFQAQGSINQQLDLHLTVNADDLHSLLTDAHGTVFAKASISGDRSAPDMDFNVTGRSLQYQQHAVDSLSGQGRISLDFQSPQTFKFDAAGVRMFDSRYKRLSGALSGPVDNQQLFIDLKGEQENYQLIVKGGMQDKQWAGHVHKLTIRNPYSGHWQLIKPAAIRWMADQYVLEQACLGSRAQASICMQLDWQQAQQSTFQGKLNIDAVAVDQFTRWLPQLAGLEGVLRGEMNTRVLLEKGIKPKVDAQLSLELQKGQLVYSAPDELEKVKENMVAEQKKLSFKLSDTVLKAHVQQNQMRMDLNSRIVDAGSFQAQVSSEDIISPVQSLPIKGQLTLSFDRLGWLSALTPEAEITRGKLESHINVTGTLTRPRLQGNITLDDLNIMIPKAGIQLTDTSLSLTPVNDREHSLAINGHSFSDAGKLMIQGKMRFPEDSPWQLNMNINGEKFQLLNLPEIKLWMSPRTRLIMEQDNLQLTGDILIPKAKIRLKEMQNVVTPSDDVVLVASDSAATDAKKRKKLMLKTRLLLQLGDEIDFSGFGLKSGIKGDLSINGEAGKTLLATGELNLYDGEYSLYGQTMDIDRGNIIYVNTPLTEPSVDLIAKRTIRDIKVSVNLTGPASKPLATFYSDPDMPQSDILSYLLLGVPLNKVEQNAGPILLKALAAVSMEGEGDMVGDITRRLGIDTVEYIEGGEDTEASILMGKYLSPDIYVSYTQGIANTLHIIQVQYILDSNWSIKTHSGEDTHVGIYFTHEKD